jgi:hypothetical protein
VIFGSFESPLISILISMAAVLMNSWKCLRSNGHGETTKNNGNW